MAKNKNGTILRIKKKNFQDKELPHELLLTARQKNKTWNAFLNNLSRDIKLTNAQLLKIMQSYKHLGCFLGKLGALLTKLSFLWLKFFCHQ